MKTHVIVTGSAGRLGRAAVKALLANGHRVFGIDRAPSRMLAPEDQRVGELPGTAELAEIFQRAKAVIHLAATPDDGEFPRKSAYDNFETDLVPNNIVGGYRVVEAARIAHGPRLILASTGQVIDGELRAGRIPVTTATPSDPRYLYACTKVFLEALGQTYARQHNMQVLAIRLGWCPRDRGQVAEISNSDLAQDVYLSPDDAGRVFVAAVESDRLPPFAIVYATSRFTHNLRYDLSETERLLNWSPQEQWPTGAEAF